MVDILSEIRIQKKHNIIFQNPSIKHSILVNIDKEIFNFKETIYQTMNDEEIEVVQTRQVFFHLFTFQQRIIKNLYIKGELSEKERDESLHEIESCEKILEKEEKIILDDHEKIFKTSKTWNYFFNEFSVLSDEDEDKINQNLRKINFNKGDIIYNHG